MRLKMMSEEPEETYHPTPGKIRPNQIITTFGPGSLVQTEYDSVLVMGIDFWKSRQMYVKKNHMYLEKITKKDHFRMPRHDKSTGQTIACVSFPKWGFCKVCKWLQPHPQFTNDDEGFHCKDHPKHGELLPARLVVVCKQGHLDEFPWVKWAHSNDKKPVPVCNNPKLIWIGGTYSSSLSSYKIKCDSCGAVNSLDGATNRYDKNLFGKVIPAGIQLYDSVTDEFYTHPCSGELPWLKQKETCKKVNDDSTLDEIKTETAFGIISRASSLYYSKVIRGIIVPELAHPIVKFLQTDVCKNKIASYREVDENISDSKIAELLLKFNKDFQIRKYTKEKILDFKNKLSERENMYKLETELDLKKIEYVDLQKNESEHDVDETEIDEEIVIKDVNLDNSHQNVFEVIKQLPILTALEVSRYFTRLSPPGEISDVSDNRKQDICKLQITNGKTKHGQPIKTKNWLPCVVKKGEGIFMTFKEDFIKKCLNSEVTKRLDSMIENHTDWENLTKWPSSNEIDSQFIFLHSISHLLIKELALASGYNEASISERIYSSEHMRGILIYTTSAGDGSLGGLVKQIDLIKIINSALKKKKVCSRDPICISEDPKRMKENNLLPHLRQNGSACFGCMMLPETSCENFNKMLDRKILVDNKFGMVREIPID